MKVNPYELGVKHANDGKENSNPFVEFSAKWGIYNSGYNKTIYPDYFCKENRANVHHHS